MTAPAETEAIAKAPRGAAPAIEVTNVSRWYATVPKIWAKYVLSDHVATRLVPPKFGDASGVRGAAWLWNA